MSDLVLDLDFNTTKAEAKQRKLTAQWEQQKQRIKELQTEEQNIIEKRNLNKRTLEHQNRVYDEQLKKVEELKQKIHNMEATGNKKQYNNDWSLTEYGRNLSLLKESEAELEKISNRIELAKTRSKELNHEAVASKLNLQSAKADLDNIGAKIVENRKRQNGFSKALKKSADSADKLTKRISGLVKRVFFFSMITKGLRALRESFGALMKEEGTKTAQYLAQLNGNLAVIGRTLYESIKPVIEWVLQKLVALTQLLATGLAKILGKNINQMKTLAKQTKKTGEEAKKATAGFDTLQTADTSSGSSSSGASDSSADFSGLNGTITNEMAYLTAAISGAMLVLGVILTFTGANIPLGLGLIVLGAAGLAATYAAKWDTLPKKTQNTITEILAIGGALMILLGLILILTSVGIPLGIGLILLGVGMVYGAIKLSPGDTFVEKIKNLWGRIKKITQNFLDWWTEKVINKVFGTSMGKALKDMLRSFAQLFEDIIDFFDAVFKGDWKRAWAALVNILIDILNIIISKINMTIQGFLGGGAKLINLIGKAFGQSWNLNADWAKIPTIPRYVPQLATGAVIPGGSPFLAMLGDQRKGKTNIEAPLETIVEAVKIAIGDPKFTIEATGSLAPLIRLLNLEIKRENNRESVWG